MNVVVLELQHAVHDRHNELGDYVTDIWQEKADE